MSQKASLRQKLINLQVIDSWDAADDSEEERKKATKKAEADAKRAAEAAANKKPKSARIQEHIDSNAAKRAELEAQLAALNDEDPNADRERRKNLEIEADLANVADLLGAATVVGTRKGNSGTLVFHKTEAGDEIPVDLATLPVFQPAGKPGFDEMRDKIVPLFIAQQKKPHYPLFLGEVFRESAKNMTSEQIKKVASTLTALANEKMKEEKLAEKGPKKNKKATAKASVTLGAATAGKSTTLDTTNYDNDVDD